MKAGILAVGSELLGTERLDTNSLRLTGILRQFGVSLIRKTVVRDQEEEIAATVQGMVGDYGLVLISGGLGPTTDDQTRQGVARALDRSLERDETLLQALRERFERWGMKMPASNACQADVIEGAQIIGNHSGTAPGMRIDHRDSTLFLFPGVPSELERMARSDLVPWLAARAAGVRVETRVVRVACVSESAVEDRLAEAYEEFGSESISILSSLGDIQIHLTASGPDERRQSRLETMVESVSRQVGAGVYAVGAEKTLEGEIGELLIHREITWATAESCTAGLLAERLTRVAGSSAYFVGGVVVYSNELKERLLGVAAATLEAHGAVSREVVQEMAEGVIDRLGSDVGIGISGVAGPGGGTEEKPVGTVHVVVARRGEEATHRELHLPGGRERVRWLASQWALELLRRRLL